MQTTAKDSDSRPHVGLGTRTATEVERRGTACCMRTTVGGEGRREQPELDSSRAAFIYIYDLRHRYAWHSIQPELVSHSHVHAQATYSVNF